MKEGSMWPNTPFPFNTTSSSVNSEQSQTAPISETEISSSSYRHLLPASMTSGVLREPRLKDTEFLIYVPKITQKHSCITFRAHSLTRSVKSTPPPLTETVLWMWIRHFSFLLYSLVMSET
jgi:hypothetical protein